ncbi:Dihydrodipicolinate synthase [Streptococcus parauberis KRS-02083]|uniref:Dihydrodipicolinate synthase n=1 Tax=Streptococcus parauberis KRS-02083 TaxID=1207545 RepID=A0ABN0ISN1_9STRE|nr:Dihydrodipicolinate synthase [Streptococcus parauberis KRS-02083]
MLLVSKTVLIWITWLILLRTSLKSSWYTLEKTDKHFTP